MPNEFIIREGFISKQPVTITGSLNVSGSITGSLITASYGVSASYTFNALSASLVQNTTSASYALSATSASRANQATKILNYSAALYTTSPITNSMAVPLGNLGYISTTPVGFSNALVLSGPDKPSGSMFLTPVYISKTGTLTKIGIPAQSSAGSPTGSIRLAIYSNSTSMLPDQLLLDAGPLYPTTTRAFQELTIAGGPVLSQGQMYWIASMLCDTITRVDYLSMQWTAGAGLLANSQNKIFNPLLGVSVPTTENALKQIAYYRYSPASTASFTGSLPQTTASYTAISYGSNRGTSPGSSSIFIGPSIYLV